MIKSMTGFGKAECECQNRKIVIEIKSLNSKQLDVNARIPSGYREKELAFRSLISKKLRRGKVDFNISVENTGGAANFSINKALALKYYKEMKSLSRELGEKDNFDYLPTLMRLPEILVSEKEDVSSDEWKMLFEAAEKAIENLDVFRTEEGKSLHLDVEKRTRKIMELLDQVAPYEKQRIENLKIKIKRDLYELTDKNNIDKNRFEQELVYYIDKLDITEEKVRLKKHCEYFTDTLNEADSQGKKLNFIGQEMGREINTMGSKAGDASIQKIVVQMKDELEKIKEQLFNIL
ncbi:MAG: YicC family protein [Bacteroidetes bacterium]|nr:MAG: YicC family protein [Bacteroidota bacterium]